MIVSQPKKQVLPKERTVIGGPDLRDDIRRPEVETVHGRFPCPCCGCRTLPVPAVDAIAYICPVCFWENDVFLRCENEPSDENHGLTLLQGQENYRQYGAVLPRLIPYVRPPLPEEADVADERERI